MTITDPPLPPLTGHWSQTQYSVTRYPGSLAAYGKPPEGGYDTGFNLNDGATTLDGSLIIGRGALTIERFAIQ